MTGGAIGSLFAQLLPAERCRAQNPPRRGRCSGHDRQTSERRGRDLARSSKLLLFEWKPRSFVPVVDRP